ncbi:hypothetical protein [Clostridium tepidiprofundi]|uniref:hypothetical protein n=1 Tax=Clostridium tepidiprofundi TaxID=420412 RepID=UPI000B0FA0D0|nr:hypothetical protein [Clostridium tepidiprofundi]
MTDTIRNNPTDSKNRMYIQKSPISQFLFSLGFFLYFSKPVLKHIEQFIKGSTQKKFF